MIALDTNVVSELIRQPADPAVVHWSDTLALAEVAIPSIVRAELLAGILRLPSGRRRESLARRVEGLLESVASPGIPFDDTAAVEYAQVGEVRRLMGRPISGLDAAIAACCLAAGMTLATRNTRDVGGWASRW